MENTEREENNLTEAEQQKSLGVMLFGFFAGIGLAFIGLMLVFTGLGALIGVGLIILGALVSIFSAIVGELEEWYLRRKAAKRSKTAKPHSTS
ncbi:MAG: hypothetical protein D6723_02495 [Acidobacteria bacterium]|nr:MAG: hypothetical protein D6723_02495 [Acidobacteriota bacterium]